MADESPAARPGPPAHGGQEARPAEISPWILWAAGATSAVFFAWSVLPAAFLFSQLLRPGAATLLTRLDMFRMLYAPVVDPSAYLDDPWLTFPLAIGLIALAAFVSIVVYIVFRVVRDGRDAWPGPVASGGASTEVLQVSAAVALVAVTLQSVVQPVPSRPTGWWFLVLALGSVTAWLSRRRPGLTPAVAILCGSALVAIVVDLLGPADGLRSPGSAWEILALAGAATAATAAVWLLVDTRRAGRSADPSAPAGDPRTGLVIGTAAAAAMGLLAIAVSASGIYASPAAVFGARPAGVHVVVLSPHIDDEAAFAGESIAWLAQHGADVTVVFATDSHGGRALDRHRAYAADRRAAAARALRTLGVARTVILGDVRDGNRMRGPRKVARIVEDMARLGLVDSRTILISVSGTGHGDHIATFQAAKVIAARAGIPLVVAWGYDAQHEIITVPPQGRWTPIDGGALALWKKASASDDYIELYADRYPFFLPRILLTARGSHDTLSVIRPEKAVSRRDDGQAGPM